VHSGEVGFAETPRPLCEATFFLLIVEEGTQKKNIQKISKKETKGKEGVL